MKTTIAILSFLFTLIALSTNVMADNKPAGAVTRVNPIEITGLGNKVGKYLSVIYAIGSRASISTSSNQISINTQQKQQTVRIEGDTVKVQAVDLQRTGLWMFYNLIVFVVHPDPTFTWKNYDFSNMNPYGSADVRVDSLTKEEFEEIKRSQYPVLTTPTGLEPVVIQMTLTPQ